MQAVQSGRYVLTDEERRQAIEQCLHDLETAESVRDRMIAVRALAALDSINVQRERNALQERQGETNATLAAMRIRAQSDPEIRALILQLAERSLDLPPPAPGPPPDQLAPAAPLPPADGPPPLPGPGGRAV
jgi:hypothetical protein